jgi:hypothetical protein
MGKRRTMGSKLLPRKLTHLTTQNSLKTVGELKYSARISHSSTTSGTRRVTVKQHENRVILKL